MAVVVDRGRELIVHWTAQQLRRVVFLVLVTQKVVILWAVASVGRVRFGPRVIIGRTSRLAVLLIVVRHVPLLHRGGLIRRVVRSVEAVVVVAAAAANIDRGLILLAPTR